MIRWRAVIGLRLGSPRKGSSGFVVNNVRKPRPAVARVPWLVGAAIAVRALWPDAPAWAQSEPAVPGVSTQPVAVVSSRTLTDNGGRLDWCHATDTIAFDRVVGRGASEVFTINPDGTGERCLTCGMTGLPPGIRGQPAWHPSCDFLVIQVQGRHFEGNRFEFVSWGIHNDLWIISADGAAAQRLVEVAPLGASLHPHFSDDGGRLIWTVRESTGQTIRQPLNPRNRTPGRENPWDGWHIAIADFQQRDGSFSLTNRRDLFRGMRGFFETHALQGDTIYFSHTRLGRPFVDEVYRARADGSAWVNLSNSPGTWDEHAKLSPGGQVITFNSSRGFDWRHPPDLAATLRMELWARTADGTVAQITRYNEGLAPRQRAIASDYAWGPDGRRIASYALITGGGQARQVIEILTLDRAY